VRTIRTAGSDRELSLFDALNLASCAAKRAVLSAGSPDKRFNREYFSAQLWADLASKYNLSKSYP